MLVKVRQESDIILLSALMQNSIFDRSQMFLEGDVLRCMINRFCWEQDPTISKKGTTLFFRNHAAFTVENVTKVKSRNFKRGIQNLLAIEGNDNLLHLIFSHAEMEVHCQKIKCFLKDLSCVWTTLKMPKYDV